MKKLLKKLFLILAMIFCASCVSAYTLSWNDSTGEDGYIIYIKQYPSGYNYPSNPAPDNLIQDLASAAMVNIPADTVQWDLPPANFIEGNRYVFTVRSTQGGSISGKSDFVCWTYPSTSQVIELPIDSGGDIQINIYQKP
jgi:hypothetical protein